MTDAVSRSRAAFAAAATPYEEVRDLCARHGFMHEAAEAVCFALPAEVCDAFLCPVAPVMRGSHTLVIVWSAGTLRALLALLPWASERGFRRIAWQRWRGGVQDERWRIVSISSLLKYE